MAVANGGGASMEALAMVGNGRGGERGRERLIHTGLGGWRGATEGSGRPGKAGGGRARACVPRAHALMPTGTRLKTGEELGWAGYSAGPHRWAAGKPGKSSLSLFIYVFYLFAMF